MRIIIIKKKRISPRKTQIIIDADRDLTIKQNFARLRVFFFFYTLKLRGALTRSAKKYITCTSFFSLFLFEDLGASVFSY